MPSQKIATSKIESIQKDSKKEKDTDVIETEKEEKETEMKPTIKDIFERLKEA